MAEKKYRSIDEITHNGEPLREILEAHRTWLKSDGSNGLKADLSEAELSHTDLSDASLGGADLTAANLNTTDLSRADLYEADLDSANLSKANLSKASISEANLFRANLSHANLHGALLNDANLTQADLSYADLSDANLSEADLSDTNLKGANLGEAMLAFAMLRRTNLQGTKLMGCLFGYTILADCDLSGAIGLETAHDAYPCTIGIDTILKSQGKIPEAFLRGVGVPEQFIQYALDLRNNPIKYYRCFISHADEDKEFTEHLHSSLRERGVQCWYYPKSARAGRGVQEQVGRAIGYDYDKVIVICSQNSLNSSGVIDEIERAIQREDAEKRRDILVSVRIDDYVFGKWDKQNWEIAYKARLKSKHIEDFTGWQDPNKYCSALDRLLLELNRQQANES